MNYLWASMIILSIVYGTISGNAGNMANSLMSSSQEAIKTLLGMCGAFVFWSGLLKVAQKAGLVDRLAGALKSILKKLFPNYADNKKITGLIAMNLGADMLGLGNAATPFGVEAVKRMSELSNGKANDDIKMFLVLNAATLQFFPTTVIAMRAAQGSKNPSDIILATIICSFISMLIGILSAKLFSSISRFKKRRERS